MVHEHVGKINQFLQNFMQQMTILAREQTFGHLPTICQLLAIRRLALR
ncbi:MAG: hypothetical protein F6K16_40400 [Symploca sp. SIO2B6]|nr:hypothetical protein [Symploca sp. SIO2B6]